MRVLVDINHPAHVHFFRYFITGMKKNGHEILITASEKDIAIQLLNEFQLEFIHVGSYGRSLLSKLLKIPIMAIRMTRLVLKHKPDVMVGLGSSRIAHASFLTAVPSYVFTDTEHATEQIILFKPFVKMIITPGSFYKDLGKKHITYNGLHELAYLHPDHFHPKPDVLKEVDLMPGNPFFILRFVSWEASHDRGQSSMGLEQRLELIKLLKEHGRVIISSEAPLPAELKAYETDLSPTKMHDLLYYARMYIGEGGTMASEAAIMGTPSVLVNSLRAGVFDELKYRYFLLEQVYDHREMMHKVRELLDRDNIKEVWKEKKEGLVADKVNVSKWMINFVENPRKKR